MSTRKGFTLIELLIVIAVLGVLAAVVLVAIDPVEQLARGRDAGRKSAVAEVGRAMQAYFTSRAAYPVVGEWTAVPATNALVISGDIRSIPSQTAPQPNPPGTTACGGGSAPNQYCYKVNATPQMVVYTHIESKSEGSKCGALPGAYVNTWFVYSSLYGRSGIVCQAAEPDPVGPFTFL